MTCLSAPRCLVTVVGRCGILFTDFNFSTEKCVGALLDTHEYFNANTVDTQAAVVDCNLGSAASLTYCLPFVLANLNITNADVMNY